MHSISLQRIADSSLRDIFKKFLRWAKSFNTPTLYPDPDIADRLMLTLTKMAQNKCRLCCRTSPMRSLYDAAQGMYREFSIDVAYEDLPLQWQQARLAAMQCAMDQRMYLIHAGKCWQRDVHPEAVETIRRVHQKFAECSAEEANRIYYTAVKALQD